MAKKEYEYKLNWRTNNVKRIEFCVNIHTDGEVVEWLKCQPNKSAYIVGLIKNDIKKSNKKR